jgi:hypothetical protein
MQVYKLKYTDKETAIADLKAKGVYTEDLSFGNGIYAIVEIGKVILTDGTYDEQGNELTAHIFADGYHYDIMSEQVIDFGVADITSLVNFPKHNFAGYNQISEEVVNEVIN